MGGDWATGIKREEACKAILRARGIRVQRSLKRFRFPTTSFSPDFHDPISNEFYEVIGSRQRGYFLFLVADLMTLCHPSVRIHFVGSDGEPYFPKMHNRKLIGWQAPLKGLVEEALLKGGFSTLGEIAQAAGMSKSRFCDALYGNNKTASKIIESWFRSRLTMAVP